MQTRQPERPAFELAQAAMVLRGLSAQNKPVRVTAFAPYAVAELLDALADALDSVPSVPEPVSRAALQIAQDLRSYGLSVGTTEQHGTRTGPA